MRKTELPKLKKDLENDKDYLVGGPKTRVYVGSYDSDYRGSTLQVLEVNLEKMKIKVQGPKSAFWMDYRNRLTVTDDPVEFRYRGLAWEEYLKTQVESAKLDSVKDHFDKDVRVGDLVAWYSTSNGVMTHGIVKSITKAPSGAYTLIMENGSKFCQNPSNLLKVE